MQIQSPDRPATRDEMLMDIASNPAAYFLAAHRDFWHLARFLVTTDEKFAVERRFPLNFPYLRRVHLTSQDNRLNLWLKSRQMMMTWYFCARFLWKANFCLPGQVFRGAFLSRGEAEAADLIRRVRFMWARLPVHLKTELVSDNTFSLEFANGALLEAFPDTPDVARTYSFTEIYSTEAGFQKYADPKWSSIWPTIDRGVAKFHCDSTPNGRAGVGAWYCQMWHNADSPFKKSTLHWRENPDYNDEWATRTKAALVDHRRWLREYEHSFEGSEGDPVFTPEEFSKLTHCAELEHIRHLEIVRGWDFGYRMPAVVFFQHDPDTDRVYVLGEVAAYQRIGLPQFAQKVLQRGLKWFGETDYDDWGDPAGNAKNDQTGDSDVELLDRDYGIKVQSQVARTEHGILSIRSLLPIREDGKPGMLFDSRRCPMLIEALVGGLVLEEGKDIHEKDGYYEHVFDALRYGIHGRRPFASARRERRSLKIHQTAGSLTRPVGPGVKPHRVGVQGRGGRG